MSSLSISRQWLKGILRFAGLSESTAKAMCGQNMIVCAKKEPAVRREIAARRDEHPGGHLSF
jgi:hypothetical protein